MSRSPSTRSAPLGIWIIAVLGALGAVADLLGGVGVLGAGFGGFFGGTVAIAFALVKLFVIVNLVRLKGWAWALTLLVYALSFVVSLLTLSLLGALLSGLVAGYVYSVREYFQ
jgi:predicted branched-subunit amino acid permease